MAERTYDVLVLGGGGVLGEAWMTGVLAGLADATGFDPTACRAFAGTSAGSIVAASLAAGRAPRRPAGEVPEAVPVPAGRTNALMSRTVSTVAALAAPASAAVGGAVGPRARRALLGRLPEGRRSLQPLRQEVASWGARFDGRLRIATVERGTGRRVVFGSGGAPQAEVADAVAASCAVPGVFGAWRIGEREYVDGGAWSPANATAAPAGRGDRVLVLEPTGFYGRGLARSITALEVLVLRRRGARVDHVVPDASAAPLMPRLMDPDRGGRVLAAGFAQGRTHGSR